jgi:hypothetical protein
MGKTFEDFGSESFLRDLISDRIEKTKSLKLPPKTERGISYH